MLMKLPARVEQKPVSNDPYRVHANDVTPRVDINGLCRGGAGEVNRREVAMLVEQEAMSGPASRVLANDVAPRVDPEEPPWRRRQAPQSS